MKVKLRIPVVVDSEGRWHAMECFDGERDFEQSMAYARDCATERSASSVAVRIAIVEAELELPAAPQVETVQGTVAT